MKKDWIQYVGMGTVALALLLAVLKYFNIFEPNTFFTAMLAIGGFITGFMFIDRAETIPFMIAALILAVATASLATLVYVGEFLKLLFGNLALVVVPAAAVVAGKVIWSSVK